MSDSPVIALLGGGQLGRMFIENALRYNARVLVLDPDAQAPCSRLAERFVQGSYADHDTVIAFAAQADVVGIEIEHVSVDALEVLAAQGKRVIPSPGVLRTIQDKGLQKEFYARHGIPSAAHVLLERGNEAANHPQLLPGFLKARRGGYDGKGVMAIDVPADAANAFDGPCVLEQRISVAAELAVLVVRCDDGTTFTYDPVEMVFDPRYHLVDHLRAPARLPGAVLTEARHLAKRVADAFGEPGLYAVELFLDNNGHLLVNETAPRAHNSGHHSIEACPSSQFDQLLRLYLGLPAGSTRLLGPAAMVNLVGEGGTGTAHLEGTAETLGMPGTFVHLYGKKETRTGRKMGHVTIVSTTEAERDAAIERVRATCRVVPATRTTTESPTR
jgi:5-(carboxyamino)imidazole ribonucleotide synthase